MYMLLCTRDMWRETSNTISHHRTKIGSEHMTVTQFSCTEKLKNICNTY